MRKEMKEWVVNQEWLETYEFYGTEEEVYRHCVSEMATYNPPFEGRIQYQSMEDCETNEIWNRATVFMQDGTGYRTNSTGGIIARFDWAPPASPDMETVSRNRMLIRNDGRWYR